MRLRRLDLDRYGKFTGQVLDFGPREAGSPDLHIVYGPNEAGKSTLFSAWLDLLYGIEPRSRYDFIHPYSTMRIGAVLEEGETTRSFARIKRPQNSLLDENDNPLPEAALPAALSGIDRNACRTMFSLDDETLEAGGESILASKGDLGQLLFSASAGLAGLGRSLSDLGDEAGRFYRYRARNHELGELKEQLAALKAERARIDTLATEHARLVEEHERAAARYDEAFEARNRTAARNDTINRQLAALPRLAALRHLREQLSALGDLPEAPAAWEEALPQLQREAVELATRARGLDGEIAALEAQLAATGVDEAVLALSGPVGRLADLRARYITAEKDLPERRLQLREQEIALSGILRRMEREGETDPARLVPGASVIGPLRDLIEARSGIDTAIAAAGEELDTARQRRDEALASLQAAAGEGAAAGAVDADALSALQAITVSLRDGDHAARLLVAQRAVDAATENLGQRMAALAPWQGDADALLRLDVPATAEIAALRAAHEAALREEQAQEAECQRLASEKARLEAEISALGGTGGVTGDDEAAQVRGRREVAWADHRRRLDSESAAQFEAALREDDVVTAGRIGRMADIERMRQLGRALVVADSAHRRAGELAANAAEKRAAVEAESAAMVAAMFGPGVTVPLARIEDWPERRRTALAAAAQMREAQRALHHALVDIEAARARLAAALAAAGVRVSPEQDLAALLAQAQSLAGREARLFALRATLAERDTDLARRERGLETAQAAERQWAGAWATACAACWLGEGGAVPDIATVREVLEAIAGLGAVLEKRAGFAYRIARMENDQALLGVAVAEILATLGEDAPSAQHDAADVAQALEDRLKAAQIALDRRLELNERLENARTARRDIAAAFAAHAVRVAEMTAFFGVDTLDDVGARLRDTGRKRQLAALAEEAERDIRETLRVADLDEAEALLAGADAAALEAEGRALQARFEDEDQRTRQLFSERSRAADRLEDIGGDDSVARLEEQRRTVILDIGERAMRYLRLRLGAAAATQALGIYRDQHRGAMLERASDAFSAMSRGAYARLATRPGGDGESLIAVTADGRSREAPELSKGTRFQLYLALRVAGYHEFARARSPLPFIADDIMETFDDLRSEEVFRLFADMALTGQVIYLTHHRHLCDMAQRICPGARLHRLG